MRASLILTQQTIIIFLLFFLLGGAAYSQTSLSLSSGSAVQGGSAALNLFLTASTVPAALEWTLSYSHDVASISIAAGPALTTESKTIQCSSIVAGSTECVASGINPNNITNGVVAIVTVTLASATSGSSVPVSIGNTMAAMAAGTAATVTGTGGIGTGQG